MDYKLRVQQLENELEVAKKRIDYLENSSLKPDGSSRTGSSGFSNFDSLFFEHLHYPAFVLDSDFNVISLNKRFREFYSPDEHAIGNSLFSLNNGSWNVPELKDLLKTIQESGSNEITTELNIPIFDDEVSIIKLDVSYIQSVNENEQFFLFTFEDITEKRKEELALERSEQRYKELVHSSNSLMAILSGPKMVVETANNSIKKIWGKGENVEGRSLFEVLPEIKDQGMPKLFKNVYKTGEAFSAKERPIKHEKDGELILRYFDFIYQPQRNKNGEVVGVSVIANDVTQQALLNQKIRKSEREFRHLIDFMPHKITVTDTEGNVTFYNKSWLDYAGKDQETMLSEPWPELIHPDEVDEVVEKVEKMLVGGYELELETRIRDKNGVYKWHLARVIPIKDEDGVINSWLSSSTEIQKIKEEEVRKEGFLKLVSHELKTPVTSIKGYVQLLLSMLDNKEDEKKGRPVKPYLNRIESQVDRLIRLISEMLDLSRIEQNEMELQLTKFNLNEHVEHIMEDLTYSNKDIQIKVQHDCDCNVVADKDRIGQVIINFVTNALKYSPDSNRVDLKVFRKDDDHVAISIKDYGIGIDEKEQQQIFKRFYRVAGNNDDTYAGFGIGLYLSNEIVERHNGRIYVNSTLGEGSEFTFTLPLNQK